MAEAAARALSPLALRLFEKALLRGTFELRSGVVSDRYFDKYRATTDPELLRMLGAALAELAAQCGSSPTAIVAPELGAVPLAAALSLETGLPFVIVRSAGKSYGTANRIEGSVPAGTRAVLVEDVVTSGGAAVEALTAARDAGIEVTEAMCVLDRDGGGREALADAGVHLRSLVSRSELDEAFEAGIGTPA